MKRSILPILLAPALVAGFFGAQYLAGRGDASRVLRGKGETALTLVSRTFKLDRIYKSMQGPYANQEGLSLTPGDPDALVWITGIETEVVDRDGETAISPEFFCHANLTLGESGNDPDAHNAAFGGRTHLDWRLFTLVPGRLTVHLPEGFGVPVRGGEKLDYLTMSLNQNVTDRTVMARFRTHLDWVRDADAPHPMKPVFRRALYGYEPLGAGAEGAMCVGGSHPGQSCGPFLGVAASRHSTVDALGKDKTMHWMVPPGRYESHTAVTDQLDLPFDTTLHYVTGHLHPYGVSLTLRDATEGRDLFTLQAEDMKDRLGVAKVEERSFPEGLPIHRDHDYELVTVYDNPTDHDIDAMAILYLYLLDKSFQEPMASTAAGGTAAPAGS